VIIATRALIKNMLMRWRRKFIYPQLALKTYCILAAEDNFEKHPLDISSPRQPTNPSSPLSAPHRHTHDQNSRCSRKHATRQFHNDANLFIVLRRLYLINSYLFRVMITIFDDESIQFQNNFFTKGLTF